MLIGEDDISNDVITSALFCFSMFVYFRACFGTFVRNLTAQSTGIPSGELEVEIIKFQRHS